MSLAVSATKVYEHNIAVDMAISFKSEGTIFRLEGETTKDKLIIVDGEAYFFSGDKELINTLKLQFTQQDDRKFEKLAQLAESIFIKYGEEGDELAFAKYGFDDKGLAYAQFGNNWLDFKPTDRYYGDSRNRFIAYGKNMRQASEHIDLTKVDITPEFFIPIYEAVADEGVGHSIFVYHLTSEKWGVTSEIMLNEPNGIRRRRIKQHATFVGSGHDAFPIAMHGEGDGQKKFDSVNPISPEMEGKSMSSRGFVSKPEGSFDMLYYSSNYGRERSLRLMDDEVLVKSENSKIHMVAKNYEIEADQGGVKIILSNGSNFEMTAAGDITVHAINNIKLTADGKIQIDAQQYDFL